MTCEKYSGVINMIRNIHGINAIRKKIIYLFDAMFRRKRYIFFEIKPSDAIFQIDTNIKVDLRIVQYNNYQNVNKNFEKFFYSRERSFEYNPEERIKLGHILILAQINEKYVHYTWIVLGKTYASINDIEIKISLNSKSAYLYDAYTIPDYRGQGIFSKSMWKILNYLDDMRIEKVYAIIRYNNLPSLRVFKKFGFKKIGEVNFTKIFYLTFYKVKGETEEDYNKLKIMISNKRD